ncbi:MAG: DUF167 domain-containing protein [Elusimicrobia bacterium]|nr:DUF167 domain-containing protein [Elusimicrobiota bacterium]
MTKINIRVIPRAKKNLVKTEPGRLKVYLTAPPHDGQANKLLVAVLAEYYQVKKKQVAIIQGEKSQDKVVKIQAAAGSSQMVVNTKNRISGNQGTR